MQLSESELQENMGLVGWERAEKREFSLTTIHSLLIDHNPQFQQLRQIVHHFNLETSPERIRLKQSFVQQLFQMLSELTRIPNSENQLDFLSKIYKWAIPEERSFDDTSSHGKSRPATASTRTRPYSAYSRPTTGRPPSGVATQNTRKANQELELKMAIKKTDPKVDYEKLKDGQRQFYAGVRSLHPEYDAPKKRLKEYQRKIFYQDEDEDLEYIDLDKEVPHKPVQVTEAQLIQDIEAGQEEGEGENAEGEGGEGAQEGEVNIDDIPMDGEEDGGAQEPADEEPAVIVDKLKPNIKAYGQPKASTLQYDQRDYEEGFRVINRYRNEKERQNQQDVELAQLEAIWAQRKGRAHSELKRRAESARIVTKRIGLAFQKEEPGIDAGRENIVHFENIQPTQVNTKGSRPVTAFIASSQKNREEIIKNAFLTGKLSSHIQKFQPPTMQSIPAPTAHTLPPPEYGMATFTAHGVKPKKKTFEEILREAEGRVIRQAEEEVFGVKQTLAKNKICMGANRIARSITYNEKELPEGDPFIGQITGMAMLKNPFIKVAKKKKKKKKK